MKKVISIVGFFLGLLAMAGTAEAGYVTTRSTGILLFAPSTSTPLSGYEQIEITGVRVGSATQALDLQATHNVVLIDTYTAVTTGGGSSFQNCAAFFPSANRIAPPLYFASTHTAVGTNSGSLSAFYEFPPGSVVRSGLVVCQQGGTTGVGSDVTIYYDLPRRRVYPE